MTRMVQLVLMTVLAAVTKDIGAVLSMSYLILHDKLPTGSV